MRRLIRHGIKEELPSRIAFALIFIKIVIAVMLWFAGWIPLVLLDHSGHYEWAAVYGFIYSAFTLFICLYGVTFRGWS